MNTSPQQQPNNTITNTAPSSTLTQHQQTISESHLVNNNNSTKILLGMAVGLELGDGKLPEKIVSEYFNDPHFNVRSSSYPMLHEIFSRHRSEL